MRQESTGNGFTDAIKAMNLKPSIRHIDHHNLEPVDGPNSRRASFERKTTARRDNLNDGPDRKPTIVQRDYSSGFNDRITEVCRN